jgi:hypothetical protein
MPLERLNNYRELTSREYNIKRRDIIFYLTGMKFAESLMPQSTEKHQHNYNLMCPGFSQMQFQRNPVILVEDPKERDMLASDIAKDYLNIRYEKPTIIELKVSDVEVKFGGGAGSPKYFSLDMQAHTVLEEKPKEVFSDRKPRF